MDLKWEVSLLIQCYEARASKLDKDDHKGRTELLTLYAKAMILNVQKGYGLFLPIDDFIEDVRGGFYTDYDGCGDLLDADGNELGYVRCNVKYLEAAKTTGTVYVAWFNK
jgi:hypothetical protein